MMRSDLGKYTPVDRGNRRPPLPKGAACLSFFLFTIGSVFMILGPLTINQDYDRGCAAVQCWMLQYTAAAVQCSAGCGVVGWCSAGYILLLRGSLVQCWAHSCSVLASHTSGVNLELSCLRAGVAFFVLGLIAFMPGGYALFVLVKHPPSMQQAL